MNNYLFESKVDSALQVCAAYGKLIESKEDSARLFYQNYMLFVLYNSLQKEDSVELYKNKFLRYATNYSNFTLAGFAQLTLGKLLINQEKPNEAIAYIERAIQIYQKYPLGSGQIESYITLSKCYGNQGEQKKRMFYLNKALDLLHQMPASKENLRNEIQSNLSLARIYNVLKYSDKAIDHATKAYQLTKNSDENKPLLSECIEMLRFAPGIGLGQKIIYLKEGLEVEKKSVNKEYFKRFAYNLANYYARLNQMDSGLYYYKLGKQSSFQLKNKTMQEAEIMSLFSAALYFQLDTCLSIIHDYEKKEYPLVDSLVHQRELSYRKKNYYFMTKQYDSFNHYQTMYEDYDKRISGYEKTEITERLNVEFESERKANEIKLLSKDNELKQLEITNNQINLAKVELENLQQRQKLLIKDLEINNKDKTIKISQAERDRKTQELMLVNRDIEAKEVQLALLKQSKENQALQAKQKFIEQESARVKEKKNIWIGFLSSSALIGLMIVFFVQKSNQRNQRKGYEALIQSIEQERDRISSDLHDDIGSTLSSIAIYNELISDKVKTKPELVPQLSEKISVQINELMRHTEDIIWSLKIGPHQNETISKRVQEYVTELLDSKQIQSHIQIEPSVEQLLQHPEQRRNMLMIIKEAMNNCRKYSQAKTFNIAMYMSQQRMILKLEDDGIGFDLDSAVLGNGIQNIRNRCLNMNGVCEIKSRVGQGTSIYCELPMPSHKK